MISLRSSFLLTVLFVLLGLSAAKHQFFNGPVLLNYSSNPVSDVTSFFLNANVNSEVSFQVTVDSTETIFPLSTLTLFLFPGFDSNAGSSPYSVSFSFVNGSTTIDSDIFARWNAMSNSPAQNNQTASLYLPLDRTIYVAASTDLQENATFSFNLEIYANSTCKEQNKFGPDCQSPALPTLSVPMEEIPQTVSLSFTEPTFFLFNFAPLNNSNSTYANVSITFSFEATTNEYPAIFLNPGFFFENTVTSINATYPKFTYTLSLPYNDPLGWFLIFVPPTTTASQYTTRDAFTYNVNVTFFPFVCDDNLVGSQCQYQLFPINSTAPAGFLYYVNATTYFYTTGESLTVSVASENTKKQAPSTQISYYPNPNTGVDAAGYFVKFAQLGVPGVVSRFYVLVTIDNSDDDALAASDDDDDDDDTPAYVWFNSACPANCTNEDPDKESPCATCSGNGACTSVGSSGNGTCTCKSNWKGFNCGTPKFKLVYIILIAIGGAIVLALAIGIPVACFFKNRKRARYERV